MAIHIHKVYTRSGDGGNTRLADGKSISKTHPLLEGYGTLYELNSAFGAARDALALPGSGWEGDSLLRLDKRLRTIQNKLFDAGSLMATPPEYHSRMPGLSEDDVTALESDMDLWTPLQPALNSFTLPGGCPFNSVLHLCRTICRRAERRLIQASAQASEQAEVQEFSQPSFPPVILKFINRLSDWCFVLSREASRRSGSPETLWERGVAWDPL
jgi:cob(I)alamin adenosyltransferase